MSEEQHAFSVLHGHMYINLTTFRKSGAAVPTPVWFAEENGKLYVVTGRNLGKVKRIRNNPRVLVEPCDRVGKKLGPSVEAEARILPDEESQRADDLLTRKYSWQKRLFELLLPITLLLSRRKNDGNVFLEITPAGPPHDQ
jgi:hypothetical protein